MLSVFDSQRLDTGVKLNVELHSTGSRFLNETPADFVQQPEKMLQLWMESSHILDQLAQYSVTHQQKMESIVVPKHLPQGLWIRMLATSDTTVDPASFTA